MINIYLTHLSVFLFYIYSNRITSSHGKRMSWPQQSPLLMITAMRYSQRMLKVGHQSLFLNVSKENMILLYISRATNTSAG